MNKMIALGGGGMIAFGAEVNTVAILVVMALFGGALTKLLGSDIVE